MSLRWLTGPGVRKRRLFGSLFIAFAILAHPSAALQNPAAPPGDLFIVVLKDPSVVEQVVDWTASLAPSARRGLMESREALQYARQLEARQLRLIREIRESRRGGGIALAAEPLEVVDRRYFLLNMLVVRGSPAALERLARHAEVRKVYPSEERYLLLDTAPSLLRAGEFWAVLGGAGNAGAGIKIGIIDSGINHQHPMFSGEGMQAPAGFPKGNLSFTNNKVIVARSYHELFPRQQPVETPEDEQGHGSRVAGIAAGRPVNAPLGAVSGIAPQAYLGNYKVFGSAALNPSTSSAAVIAALNDAVQDGMDVVNLSLGGSARDPETDPEQQAVRMAVEAGVVVVAAAGNSGPGAGSVASPGTSPDAITVASVSHGRILAPALQITSTPAPPSSLRNIAYVAGTQVTISQEHGPFPLVSVQKQDPSEEACQPFASSTFADRVVLVRRGGCLFKTKAQNIFNAGAKGLVVYNNVSGGAVRMDLQDFQPPFPAVMIDQNSGQGLRDFVNQQSPVQITFRPESSLVPFASQGDVVSGFSSRGPTSKPTFTGLKPDLSAIGENVYTATHQPDGYSANSNGTSFSAPMVAGAAALVKQLHPGWSPRAIKSALVNSASRTVTSGAGPARVIETGNGRLDLGRALLTHSVLDPVGASFGILDAASAGTSQKRELTLTNLGTVTRTYEISWVPQVSHPSVTILVTPTLVSLAPGESTRLSVQARLEPVLKAGTFEGFLRIRDQSGVELIAAAWGGILAQDRSVVLEVSQTRPGAFSDLTEAVRQARPGNIIEITDSSTYRGSLRLELNQEGLPLHGLILRAAPGQNPTLDATGFASGSAALEVRNLENVWIQGLRVRGGLQGIRYLNSSGVLQGNTILDTLPGSEAFGVELRNSRVHLFENRIQKSGNAGLSLQMSSTLAQQNVIGQVEEPSSPATALGNRASGISAAPGSIVALFQNNFSRNGTQEGGGQGVRLTRARALLKGNRIFSNGGNLGDGILAQGVTSEAILIQDNLITGNQRHGIHLLDGTQALLRRNRILNNSGSGVFLSGSSSVADALDIRGNGGGIRALNSTLTLSNSLLALAGSSSEGHGLHGESSELTVTHCTIASNLLSGIRLSSPKQTGISNSLLSANQKGDLSGVPSAALSNNLIGDGTSSGSNNNFAADPQFAGTSTQDFSLKAGSPAIDRGTVEASLPANDVRGRHRFVDGDGDGKAFPDLGAFEFSSSYSTPLILPVLSLAPEEFLGLAITNVFSEPAESQSPQQSSVPPLLLRAYDQEGNLYNTFQAELSPESQLSLLLTEAFPDLRSGWVEILPSQPDFMSFTLLGNYNLDFLDGSQLGPAQDSFLLFPEVRNGDGQRTVLFLVNPNRESVNLELRWRSSAGVVFTRTQTLPPRASWNVPVEQVFENASGGYLTVSSGGAPIYGLEIFGNSRARGGLLGLPSSARAGQLFGAQLASTADLETVINLVNFGPSQVVLLEALADDGKVVAATEVTLAAGGQLRQGARSLFGLGPAPFIGWLRVSSPSGQLQGSLSFEGTSGGFLASLPLQSRGAREFTLSHIAQTERIFTGITLLNTQDTSSLVSLEVFGRTGRRIGLAFLELLPGEKAARLLEEWIPGLGSLEGGFIRVRSSLPIFGFELFGNQNLDFLAAVPAQVSVH